jgi:sulfur carrier protein ThiS
MSVIIITRNHTYQVEGNCPLGRVLKRLNFNSQSVLAVRNGTLITEDEILKEDERIELIEVISGG